MKSLTESLGDAIFREDSSAYAVLDGASIPDLLPHLDEAQRPAECLIAGELVPDLAIAAPYLVELRRGDEFTNWVLEKGWGQHWGIFARAAADLRVMRQHFRGLLTVYDESGKPLLFRFYDPRVIRVYLPTCAAGQLAEFFGPVTEYVSEGDGGQSLLSYRADGGALVADTVNLSS